MASTHEQNVWRFGEIGAGIAAMKQHREPIPTPGSGQYLVRIHSVSLNYRDIVYADGTYAAPGLKAGVVPCSDMAGEIVAVGKVGVKLTSRAVTLRSCRASQNAAKFAIGERVTSIQEQANIYGLTDAEHPRKLCNAFTLS